MSWWKSRKTETLDLPYDSSLVYSILTDFDSYFEWLPFVTGSRLLAAEGDLAIAEFTVREPVSKLALESIHSQNELVLLRRISGDSPLAEMIWRIAAAQNGQCRVSLELSLERNPLSILLRRPFFWRHQTLLDCLRIRAALLSGEPTEGLPIYKMVEIAETGEGMVLWLFGKKYLLQPLPEEEND